MGSNLGHPNMEYGEWYNDKNDFSKWLINALGIKSEEEFDALDDEFKGVMMDVYQLSDDKETPLSNLYISEDLTNSLKNKGYTKETIEHITPEQWRDVYADYKKGLDAFKSKYPYIPYNMRYDEAYKNSWMPKQEPTMEPNQRLQPQNVKPDTINSPLRPENTVNPVVPIEMPKQEPVQQRKKTGALETYIEDMKYSQKSMPTGGRQQPQVDTSHALSSISQLMGPTPAEREAKLRKQEAHNNKMMKWAGLFDGLRQLGNLYTTYKGATPQQLQAPYGQLIQQADRQRKLQAADDAYRKEYANTYQRLMHGINDDARKAKIAEAQAKYFDARGEMAQQKAELEKLKSVRVVKQKDGSLWKFDPVSGELEQLKESDPLYSKYVQSQIDKNNRMGYGHSGGSGTGRSGKDNGTYGYKIVEYIDEQGRKVKERIPTTGNNPNKAPANQRERTVTTKEPKKKSAPQPAKRTSEKRKSKTSI